MNAIAPCALAVPTEEELMDLAPHEAALRLFAVHSDVYLPAIRQKITMALADDCAPSSVVVELIELERTILRELDEAIPPPPSRLEENAEDIELADDAFAEDAFAELNAPFHVNNRELL